MRRCLAVLPVVVALAACGGGDDTDDQSADATAYVDAMAAQLRSPEDFAMSEQDARCFAEAVVTGLDAAALDRAGITPAALADTDAFAALPMTVPEGFTTQLHDAVLRCGVISSLESFYVDGLESEIGTTLTTDASGCIVGAVDDNALALTITASMMDATTSEDGVFQVFENSLAACPDAVAELLVGGMVAAGGAVSPEADACIHAYVAADPQTAASIMAAGTGGEEYGVQLAQACPQLAG